MANQDQAMQAGRASSLGRIDQGAPKLAPPMGVNAKHIDRGGLSGAARIKLGRIMADPEQPRRTFDPEPLGRLAENMKKWGQLVPAMVRWSPEHEKYIVIDGERRFRAAQEAGLSDLACVVEDPTDPDEILEVQLITNALREDVPVMEQAHAWDRLMKSKGYTHAELAAKLGYDRSAVTRTVGLTRLPEAIQQSVSAGEIAPQTAYELSRVADPVEQERLATEAKAGTLKRDDLRGSGRAAPSRMAPAKGRGGRAKSKPLPTHWKFPRAGGWRLTIERAKGIDPTELIAMLEAAIEKARAELDADGG